MKELPLLLSTPMVQAYLARRKTVTRRMPNCMNSLVDGKRVSGKKWKELAFDWDTVIVSEKNDGFMVHSGYTGKAHVITPVYRPGDILYFRENWFPGAINGNKIMVCFDKEDPKQSIEIETEDPVPYWKKMKRARIIPSIHLPIEATRLWAECTACTCERVQDITEEQSIAEGILWYYDKVIGTRFKDYMADASGYGHPEHDYPTTGDAITSFGTLWASIRGLESWQANPPVYAISYKILSTTGKPLEKENV